ncbi:MAG: hypothetical protein SAJ12_18635 [Jaaginema sp. PMC 1079.18]|nr:hypothetical protein [Jaaginema sp. PMC 1080.18]MEC4853003.1 hypothetical protein [Jaaginema sp. PMC 1079.18]
MWRNLIILLLCCWLPAQNAIAATLSDRVTQFPQWSGIATVETAQGDLVYPDWFRGTWQATSTLREMQAPLAPNLKTPGFEGNRQYLDQPVAFTVKFGRDRGRNNLVVADRAFNGDSIAKAYLGAAVVRSVKVDPNNPNRQITLLSPGQQLISTVTGRKSETVSRDRFIATEITRQVFRQPSQIYINTVEITTAYQRLDPQTITATQFAAIYLAPEDPDYFQALGHPVALYRYDLNLVKSEAKVELAN